NIRLGRPDASDAEVRAAAEAAHAREFIEALPQGFDTPLGERGLGLSAGQRQRIALARAFLRDAPLLLLDEPTSNLDAESEAAVVDAVSRLAATRTVLLVAHPPALIALARAFLRDAPLLLLDEPTSNLDAESEAAVVDAVSRLAATRTVLLVAHRPALIALADRTVSLEPAGVPT